ncbi:hypothetical protein [Candidatus Mycobacterium methanotrophicum]|uniref:PE domain-containing protein n=1 Tax=Candidatus Mycobacterium methanotrophicum TaxID=2943498 RepID=A0ABY4QUA0_9MYCO|nr:hypothetical protein [Candidatus Mycobacterium methanotrophicum]UQX13435.1 hypothetical protein M5I08_24830 [Candidatus Mycobacterium methanotrophicum]
MAFHPQVEQFLADSKRLSDALGAIEAAAFDNLRVRRAAPDEPEVMPEIDGWGALTDVYLGEGVVQRYRAEELGELVMSGVRECYAVLEDRRREAAHAAAPDLGPALWAEAPDEHSIGNDDHEATGEGSAV